jgi:hypothetical protein
MTSRFGVSSETAKRRDDASMSKFLSRPGFCVFSFLVASAMTYGRRSRRGQMQATGVPVQIGKLFRASSQGERRGSILARGGGNR